MKLRRLYSRLALALLGLLLLLGSVLMWMLFQTAQDYQQEVAQQLNFNLAQQIVSDDPLFRSARQHPDWPLTFNSEDMDRLFHQMMVINPAIEVYLLDQNGKILEFDAEPTSIKMQQVALAPIERFLSPGATPPILGDDPKNPGLPKVFSAAAIELGAETRGYLYIVLGGKQYQDTREMLAQSYIVRSAFWFVLLAILSAVVLGGWVFALLTRRLHRLSNQLQQWSSAGEQALLLAKPVQTSQSHDEIDALSLQFHNMAERIGKQMQQLRQLDLSRREMVASLSHDLRTPLTTLRGYLETLQLQWPELNEKDKATYIDTALGQSLRLGCMIEEMFELSRLDSIEQLANTAPLSISELVQDVTQKYQLRASDRELQLELHIDPRTAMIHGDIGLLQRLLENLLENAFRHVAENGFIRVSVEPAEEFACISVQDNGPGIAASEIDRVFERFYQAQAHRPLAPAPQGFGLGLAIVRRIVELHQGMICVRSPSGEGAGFRFCLPAIKGHF